MENLNIELSPVMLAMIPVVAALLQMLKKIPYIVQYKEWLPMVSMVISFGLLYYQKVPEPIIPAIIIGLTACGGFDLLKGKKTEVIG